MENVRMQTKVTHYCNLDLLNEYGKPVQCHISNGMETMGLVLPGMDDGKSLTTLHDVFIVKDGQVTVQASPSRPYQYLLTSETDAHSQTLQLFNKKSFLVHHAGKTHGAPSANRRLDVGHTLEKDGWAHHGLVEVDGQKVNKWVRSGAGGVDSKTHANFTALAQTGLVPNSWTLYTDEADEKMVKLLATNTFENNKVYQVTEVTHWEKLDEAKTVDDTLKQVYSTYDIADHSTAPPTEDEAPLLEARFIKTHLISESARIFFNDGEHPDWRPSTRRLRGKQATPSIDYFTIVEGTASHKYFLEQYQRQLLDLPKFVFPKGCTIGMSTDGVPYCLNVGVSANTTALSLNFGMIFVDVNNKDYQASLKISITMKWPQADVVLGLSFEGSGCAVVFQKGVSFARLYIQVCITASGSGKNLLQPDNRTFAGKASVSVSFNIDVSVVTTLKATLTSEVDVQVAPHSDIKAHGSLGLDLSLVVVGAGVSVDIFGNTVKNHANVWDFQSHVNLHVWVNIWVYKHTWPWTWTIWKAGPVTF
ncbi:hypothetical protein Pmar_PMAR026403 [Perkinsus marinus ATCC 50983]|uniref:Uncharacterized protein n=1 Tax=Perkinsus marinus (strain ATCC 50983 / TXsc) TaxID=423536 RepID=C5LEN3_PERM5|nr:hypothetical protein Pmar_PMAR026403 [Perkinsus marinus ATCC 50983]EER04851.1 hypothetical protein Pmar_PMAR026403 [Perkinsus marinus ATCC 50983]|eukprot:XP_002773035.1 hypothetical protein Pmar_PMAR026403 [Perkinsus marinus ATCC 50983]